MRRLVRLTAIIVLGLAAGCTTTTTPSPTATPMPTKPPTAMSATGTPGTVECRARPFGKVEGLPPVSDEDWVRGPAAASITLIEYADFQ